jgi:hypothetical protein
MHEESETRDISIGEWIFTLILTWLPVIGFIMLLLWAFDKGTHPSKANWAKAQLVIFLSFFGVFFLLVSLIGLGALLEFLEINGDYY